MKRSLLLIACAMLASCAPSNLGPYSTDLQRPRDIALAQQLNTQGADLLAEDPVKAEAVLREALNADLYCGPAHNNLGVAFLKQGKLYEAAEEFEWAKKLLPGHPDPRMNLALTLERAGHADDAIATYADALAVYPGHIPTMQAMSRLMVRSGRADDRTREMLREVSLKGQTPRWRSWAQEQALRLGAS